MTVEEALFKCKYEICFDCGTEDEDDLENIVIQALEKQIPKKYVDGRYPWAICPTCGGSINTEIVQEHIQNCETSYCEQCGQAIDWSETE